MALDCVAIVTASAANVRVQPRSGTSIVAIVRLNDNLPVHEVSPPDDSNFPWVRVTVPATNTQGWIRGDLVQLKGNCESVGALSISAAVTMTTTTTVVTSISGPTASPSVVVSSSTTVVLPGDCRGEVNAARVNVRSEPHKNGSRLGSLARGVAFVIEEISPEDSDGFNWYKLDYQEQSGWVREDLITISGDCHDAQSHTERPTPIATSTPTTPTTQSTTTPAETMATQPEAVVSGCGAAIGPLTVNVRATPTTTAAVVGQAPANTVYAVKSVTEPQADGFRWIQIDFQGRDGYVRNDLAGLRGNCADFTSDDRLPQPAAVRVTQGFRPANNPQHNGLDFGTPEGTELRVAINASVVRAHVCTNCDRTPPNITPRNDAERQQVFRDPAWGYGYGHHIVISHEFSDLPRSTQEQLLRLGGTSRDKVFVLYAHLSRMDVQVNQRLTPNTLLGLSGNTGNSTGAHLHLEVGYGADWGTAKKANPNILFAVA